MELLATAGGVSLILIVLWETFETVVLPRRVSRRFRLTRLFYRATWKPYAAISLRRPSGNPRENFLSIFGPLSLIVLLATWALALVFGFALIQWGLGSHLAAPPGLAGFGADLYLSGTTLFTLGLGDVVPTSTPGRIVTTIEAGTGFGFLALVIAYLPILAQASARRETPIALLDARAGSPPTAAELLRRHADGDPSDALAPLFNDWERWSAELLEAHISFPVLAFYRSQHDNQSWVSALTMVLDTCALVITGVDGAPVRPARLTFAMARHALADLTAVLGQRPRAAAPDRLPPAELARLRHVLAAARISLCEGREADEHLAHLRGLYEPYANALGEFLLMGLPPLAPSGGRPGQLGNDGVGPGPCGRFQSPMPPAMMEAA